MSYYPHPVPFAPANDVRAESWLHEDCATRATDTGIDCERAGNWAGASSAWSRAADCYAKAAACRARASDMLGGTQEDRTIAEAHLRDFREAHTIACLLNERANGRTVVIPSWSCR